MENYNNKKEEIIEEIPPNVNGYASGDRGLLKHLGYSVDKGSYAANIRALKLKRAFEATFVSGKESSNQDYLDEFGEPRSKERFLKIHDILESFIVKYQNNLSEGWRSCVKKWNDDLDWFIEEYAESVNVRFE